MFVVVSSTVMDTVVGSQVTEVECSAVADRLRVFMLGVRLVGNNAVVLFWLHLCQIVPESSFVSREYRLSVSN